MQSAPRKLKILISTLNFSPELTGVGKYSGEMAHWLASRGHEVRVVTAPPYYPDWRVWPGYSAFSFRKEELAGVRVYRCPIWVPQRASGLKRIVHLASFAASNLFAMLWQLRWRPDVVWVVQPALLTAPTALLVAGVTGARSWLHVQDYEVDAAFEMGLLKGRRIRSLVAAGERALMRRFARVSSISKKMVELARSKGMPSERLALFPNWVDVSDIQPLAKQSGYRTELGIEDGQAVALYSGNMGAKQGLEILAEVAQLLERERSVTFVFCGDGVGKADLVQRCATLANVRILPLQPKERLNELLGLADIHLLPQRADAADLVLPSKLTGMLASGKAVIATAHANTELAAVVNRSGCGVVVAPENAAAFADAVRTLAMDQPSRERMGAAGRVFAQRELNAAAVLGRFEHELQILVTSGLAPTWKGEESRENQQGYLVDRPSPD